jgi:hypothetical protein
MSAGFGLHKNCVEVALVEDSGKLVKEKRIPNGDGEILSFFED